MAKSLMRFSGLMKRVPKLSKCVSTTRFCHSNGDFKEISVEVKDTPFATSSTSGIKVEKLSAKQLLELVKDDSDLSRLMKNLETYKNKIECHHAVLALTSMHKYFQNNNVPNTEVHSNEHFLSMCTILDRYLTSMDLTQIIQSLKILNFLQVSSSSVIVQSLLQLVRYSINDLALHEIYYLSYLLKLMEPTPLSSAINISLPIVFMSQLELKLEKDNIKELEHALRFASDNKVNEQTIQYLLDVMNDCLEPPDLSTAIDILLSLFKIKNTSKSYYDVLYSVQSVILNESGPVKQQAVISAIVSMCTLIANGYEQFYNAEVLDKLINHVIIGNYDFNKGAFILNKLNKFNYINIPLLKYLSQLCCDNPSILSKCSPLAISSLITGLAFANFKPPQWNELQEIIVNNYTRITDDPTLSYLALRLVSLDCFNTKLLSYVFDIDQQTQLMSYHYYQAIKRLYIIVKTLHPNYSGTWPSQKLIDSFRESRTKKTKLDSLLPALKKIVKNPSFIKTDIKTHLGHEIDFLIFVRNNSPIAVQPKDPQSTAYVEDFIIPPNCEKIAIMVLPKKAFGKNIPRMEASFASYIKSLEALSFTVAYISEQLWKTLYDYERFPYLRCLLKLTPAINFEHKREKERL